MPFALSSFWMKLLLGARRNSHSCQTRCGLGGSMTWASSGTDLLIAAPSQEQCESDTIKLLAHLAVEGHKVRLSKLQYVKQTYFLAMTFLKRASLSPRNVLMPLSICLNPRQRSNSCPLFAFVLTAGPSSLILRFSRHLWGHYSMERTFLQEIRSRGCLRPTRLSWMSAGTHFGFT